MIKFFRHIRQRLLSENRFSKYLLYATGEIILVVIGILVALQVNNYNEQGKLKKQEIQILESIGTELENKLDIVNEALELNRGMRKSIEILLRHLEENKPYNDSLSFHYANTTNLYTNRLPSGSYDIKS